MKTLLARLDVQTDDGDRLKRIMLLSFLVFAALC